MVKYNGAITAVEKARNFGFIAVDSFTQADGSAHGLLMGVNARGYPNAVFVHHSVLPNREALRVGTKMTFEVEKTEKGHQVVKGTVTVLETGPEPAATPKTEKPRLRVRKVEYPQTASTVGKTVEAESGIFAGWVKKLMRV